MALVSAPEFKFRKKPPEAPFSASGTIYFRVTAPRSEQERRDDGGPSVLRCRLNAGSGIAAAFNGLVPHRGNERHDAYPLVSMSHGLGSSYTSTSALPVVFEAPVTIAV